MSISDDDLNWGNTTGTRLRSFQYPNFYIPMTLIIAQKYDTPGHIVLGGPQKNTFCLYPHITVQHHSFLILRVCTFAAWHSETTTAMPKCKKLVELQPTTSPCNIPSDAPSSDVVSYLYWSYVSKQKKPNKFQERIVYIGKMCVRKHF